MSLTEFILTLLFMQMNRTGLRYATGEWWQHVPSGERIPIPDITFRKPSTRAAAAKSIERRINALMKG